nr:MAG TPA: hypothetical protein [Bacteriophage sp.]
MWRSCSNLGIFYPNIFDRNPVVNSCIFHI